MSKIDELMEELSEDKFRSHRFGVTNSAPLYQECLQELGIFSCKTCNRHDLEGGGSQLPYILQYQILTLHKRIEELEEKLNASNL